MKKRHKRALYNMMLAAMLIIFVYVAATILNAYEEEKAPKPVGDSFEQVKKYEPEIHNELAKYHLENYTPVLLAVMQHESHGYGGDPMQASEAVGLAPNTIKDPKKSIQEGVKHFQRILTYGKQKNVDFSTILQAYNMGIGYIDFVAAHGGINSEKLAKDFSIIQVHKKPNVYNCGGDKSNFRFPYCYGDFTYSTKVEKTLNAINTVTTVDETKKTPKSPF
jgi:hypothetical protein